MTTSTSESPAELIRSTARTLGFDVCEFAPVTRPWAAGEALRGFVARGRHGTMSWMESTLERRAHPQSMWPEARSAVVVGMNYGPDHDPLAALARRSRAAISVYAQGCDYHDVVKGRLKSLAGVIHRRLGGEVKVFVDTAPLMEKPLAALAGVGWQGKHTNLVSREFGSWLFLGVVLTTLDLASDGPAEDACGTCRACLDICPTDALPAPYQLDARACLSYLTIEHAGPIPERYRKAMGNRIYGCDDCLAVCPWNKFASTAREAKLHARDALRAPALADLASLDDQGFRALFTASPVKRIGRDRFVRNVLYAIGNSADSSLLPVARARLEDTSEVVRDAARWAVSQLAPASPDPRTTRPATPRSDPV
ncbi:MAG TPA: tRNA epoxyqueuosine(34) reductase QueG [Caulobacteraceae bacterium]|jgi:epoxyqueuosine reductase